MRALLCVAGPLVLDRVLYNQSRVRMELEFVLLRLNSPFFG